MAKKIDDPSIAYANDLTRDIRVIGYDADDPNHRDVYVRASDIITARLKNTVFGHPAGGPGYGVAAPVLPENSGFEMISGTGYFDPYHTEFGNVRHINSGSVGVVVPALGFKYDVVSNKWVSAYLADYSYDLVSMAADGYFLHEAFFSGGTEASPNVVEFLFVDKCLNSKVALGTGFTTASIINGHPLSCHADDAPIADITACAGVNAYYAAVRAPKGRDSVNGEYDANSKWHCETRQITGLLALMSLCHGHAATSSTYCAWYDPAGLTNFPKGCDNNALGSVDDGALAWQPSGYSNKPLAGSCNNLAKTTHNGQACGVTDIAGSMYRVTLGVTRGTENDKFYVLKPHIDPATLDWGTGPGNWWGSNSDLDATHNVIDLPLIESLSGWYRYGDGASQALFTDPSRASCAAPAALSSGGTAEYGFDGTYCYRRGQMCLLSGLSWGNGSIAGVFSAAWLYARSSASVYVGVRAACALDVER